MVFPGGSAPKPSLPGWEAALSTVGFWSRVAYAVLSVAALAGSLGALGGAPVEELGGHILVFGMGVLTLPIGIAVAYAWAWAAFAVLDHFPGSVAAKLLGVTGPAGVVVMWCVFVVAGYVQWFVVGKAILHRVRRLR